MEFPIYGKIKAKCSKTTNQIQILLVVVISTCSTKLAQLCKPTAGFQFSQGSREPVRIFSADKKNGAPLPIETQQSLLLGTEGLSMIKLPIQLLGHVIGANHQHPEGKKIHDPRASGSPGTTLTALGLEDFRTELVRFLTRRNMVTGGEAKKENDIFYQKNIRIKRGKHKVLTLQPGLTV